MLTNSFTGWFPWYVVSLPTDSQGNMPVVLFCQYCWLAVYLMTNQETSHLVSLTGPQEISYGSVIFSCDLLLWLVRFFRYFWSKKIFLQLPKHFPCTAKNWPIKLRVLYVDLQLKQGVLGSIEARFKYGCDIFCILFAMTWQSYENSIVRLFSTVITGKCRVTVILTTNSSMPQRNCLCQALLQQIQGAY